MNDLFLGIQKTKQVSRLEIRPRLGHFNDNHVPVVIQEDNATKRDVRRVVKSFPVLPAYLCAVPSSWSRSPKDFVMVFALSAKIGNFTLFARPMAAKGFSSQARCV